MKGHANFLAEPHVGVNADLALHQVDIEPLLPVTGHYNIFLRGGVLSAHGQLEYTAEGKTEADLKMLTIEHLHADYIHTTASKPTEEQMGRTAVKTSKKLSNKPEARIHIEHAEIRDSEFGFVDRAANPQYRVFISDVAFQLDHISNHLSDGSGAVTITGAFMGSGATRINGTFRPETKSPDFDLAVKIEKTQMKTMNKLLRAYGNFDVTAGRFSLYSELSVKNGRVEGYIKPLFKDIEVYDARQDEGKNLFHKLYEGLVEGVAELLENTPRDEVATKTHMSGPLEYPQTSTWQTVVNLVKNAFFKAFLPGFEKEIRR